MATRKNANADDAMPFSMQPGRVEDFVQGMKESSDASARAALEALGVYAGIRSWSAFRRYMRTH